MMKGWCALAHAWGVERFTQGEERERETLQAFLLYNFLAQALLVLRAETRFDEGQEKTHVSFFGQHLHKDLSQEQKKKTTTQQDEKRDPARTVVGCES